MAKRLTYTHFWASGPQRVDGRLWTEFANQATILCRSYPEFIVPQSLLISILGERIVTFDIPKRGIEGHFKLTAEPQSFAFCRTNRTGSDVLITALLLAAKQVFGSWITLTSDGLWNDWEPGIQACKDRLKYQDSQFESAKKDFTDLLG